jgi:hypothetical protein
VTVKEGEKVAKHRLTQVPQELRLADITTVEGANEFLRERYIGEFNGKFSVNASEKGTAFRRTSRTDLNRVFMVKTERVVAKDNTVAVGNRLWQIDKTRFRNTLAGSTVTIHEHMHETVSIRFGPHVVGRFDGAGARLTGTATEKRRGKGGSMETGPNGRDSHFPPRRLRWALFSAQKRRWRLAPPKTPNIPRLPLSHVLLHDLDQIARPNRL